MKLHTIAFILLVIGGLNWLLVAIWPSWDLGMYITPMIARIVYALVGVSAIVEAAGHKKLCRNCNPSGQQM
ncbi:DUF378 domain-containing protein [Candidatus Parcubacteria bacterium]|nr:DUF378 domain-containing protein [Candidatus Parcubacteria bacterium]